MAFVPTLLSGKAALVTGGGTGICRGIALAFARHGCDVAITSRRPEHLAPTLAEVEACGVRGLALPADVRDPEAIGEVVDRVAGAFGRLDLLVNGAAGNFPCDAASLSPNGFGHPSGSPMYSVTEDAITLPDASSFARPAVISTAWRIISGVMLSSRMRSTPRRMAASTSSSVRASTSMASTSWA